MATSATSANNNHWARGRALIFILALFRWLSIDQHEDDDDDDDDNDDDYGHWHGVYSSIFASEI